MIKEDTQRLGPGGDLKSKEEKGSFIKNKKRKSNFASIENSRK